MGEWQFWGACMQDCYNDTWIKSGKCVKCTNDDVFCTDQQILDTGSFTCLSLNYKRVPSRKYKVLKKDNSTDGCNGSNCNVPVNCYMESNDNIKHRHHDIVVPVDSIRCHSTIDSTINDKDKDKETMKKVFIFTTVMLVSCFILLPMVVFRRRD